MNKFLLISLVSAIFISCEKIPDGIVESQIINYSVASISAPSSVTYRSNDSTVVVSLKIINTQFIGRVWGKVSSIDGNLKIADQITLYDDGNQIANGDMARDDGTYSARFVMGKLKPNGNYQIEFYVENNIQQAPDNLTKVGTHLFIFDNLQVNYAPLISNLILQSSVNRAESFIFSLVVSDPNGQADIMQVYFKLFRPDGSKVMNGASDFFLMVDNGDPNYGDLAAGDGIYSFKNSFGATAPTGSWKFEFNSKDFGNKISNTLAQNVTVN